VQAETLYGTLCRGIARHILPDERDVEECISDVWTRLWDAIPPERPRCLRAYLARITRNLALDKIGYRQAGKRKSSLEEAFEELEPCLTGGDDEPQLAAEAAELREFLRAFLDALPTENRIFFVRRYWYGDSVREIAQEMGASEEKVKSSLFRTRNRLRETMKKEGISI